MANTLRRHSLSTLMRQTYAQFLNDQKYYTHPYMLLFHRINLSNYVVMFQATYLHSHKTYIVRTS